MIYTIGHSILSINDFLKLIKPIATVIDIRSHPTSKWPQYHKTEMEKWLPTAGKQYKWEPGLGGWDVRHAPLTEEMRKHNVDITSYLNGKFPKQTIAKKIQDYPLFEEKPIWTNVGLRDYSYFMTLPEFLEAANQLIEQGRNENVGILCCELQWWRCHRSMVSDYLVYQGSDALHLQPKSVLHSQVIGNRLQRYDEYVSKIWQKAAEEKWAWLTK